MVISFAVMRRICFALCLVFMCSVFSLQPIAFSQTAPRTPATIHALLKALYDATGGASWISSDNWDVDNVPSNIADFDDWYGVTMDGNELVALDLSRNNLVATSFPTSSISGLLDLEELDLSANTLTGSFPSAAFTGLRNLKVLDIELNCNEDRTSCLTSSTILNDLLSLSNLVDVDIRNNSFSGTIPTSISSLQNLEEYKISGNNFTGSIPSQITNLPELRALFLFNNQFTGLLPRELLSTDIRFFSFEPSDKTASNALCAPDDQRFRDWMTDRNILPRAPSAFYCDKLMLAYTNATDADRFYFRNEPAPAFVFPSPTSGTAPYTFQIVDPVTHAPKAPPQGLRFTPNARDNNIVGTPTQVTAPTSYTYLVTDSDGVPGTLEFIIEVNNPLSFGTQTIANQSFQRDVFVDFNLPEASGGSVSEDYTYTLSPTTLPMGLMFGERVIVGTPTQLFTLQEFTYTVTDRRNTTAELTFNIEVTNANPSLAFTGTISDQTFTQGQQINDLVLPNARGGQGPYRFILSSLPSGLSFNSTSRTISGTPRTATSGMSMTYLVTDRANPPAEARLTFTITVETAGNQALSLPSVSNQTFTQGSQVNLVLPAATGGTSPYTYTLTPTSLPTGLQFAASSRTISGTPTVVSASQNFTYGVTDSDVTQRSQQFSIEVSAPPPPPPPPTPQNLSLSGTVSDQSFTLGQTVDIELPIATGGSTPYTYTLVPSLPNGLTFDDDSRTISGIPQAIAPSTTFTYTVQDSDGDTDSETFTIQVNAPGALSISSSVDDQSFTVNQPITDLVLPIATGGLPPYAYTLAPALPNGLSFNSDSRTISGTPNSVTTPIIFTYSVEDANGSSDSETFNIEVNEVAAPLILDGSVGAQSFTQGVSITDLVLPPASGGTSPYSYTLTPDLPNGLSFNSSTRTISGTPMDAFDQTLFTYSVVDADQTTASIQFNLEVTALIQLTLISTVDDQLLPKDLPVTNFVLPAAEGGIPPYTYTLTPTLPDGLTFDDKARSITGIPTMLSDNQTYTYMVTDSNGMSAHTNFNIEVYVLSFAASVANQSYPRGQEITTLVLPEVTNGIAPIQYTLTLLSLPIGLMYDSPTRSISGVPSQISPAVTMKYQAMDANGAQNSLEFTIEVVSPVSTEDIDHLPQEFNLHANYPNPFQHSTKLVFDLPWSARIQIEVLDVTGRSVHTQPEVSVTSGWAREIELDALTLPSGSYLYRMIATSLKENTTAVHVGYFMSLK